MRERFAREGVAAGHGIHRGASVTAFLRGPGRCLNFRGERSSGLLVNSSSAVDCKLTAENIFESSWTGTGGKGESRMEGWWIREVGVAGKSTAGAC